MKRWMTLLLGCLLLCTACGKKELLGSIALREDTTPEQMIEELSQRYDLPESMLLESAADLAALQGIMLFWSSSPPMIWILCSRRLWIILSEGNSKKKWLHTNLNSCIIS